MKVHIHRRQLTSIILTERPLHTTSTHRPSVSATQQLSPYLQPPSFPFSNITHRSWENSLRAAHALRYIYGTNIRSRAAQFGRVVALLAVAGERAAGVKERTPLLLPPFKADWMQSYLAARVTSG